MRRLGSVLFSMLVLLVAVVPATAQDTKIGVTAVVNPNATAKCLQRPGAHCWLAPMCSARRT